MRAPTATRRANVHYEKAPVLRAHGEMAQLFVLWLLSHQLTRRRVRFSTLAMFQTIQCGSAAWLLMHVEEVSTAGVKAIFHFLYPGTTQYGACCTANGTRRIVAYSAWIRAIGFHRLLERLSRLG